MAWRYAIFNALHAVRGVFSAQRRRKRMQVFIAKMNIRGGETVIDLGGVPQFWNDCPFPLKITVVNLPGSLVRDHGDGRHTFTFVEGSACDLPEFADHSFDIAFSNSVIEHVGPASFQQALAHEARRLAPRYWVQTPSIWFPIEAHTHMPFWWAYPEPMKAWFIRNWRQKLPAWTEMIEGTTVIKRDALVQMFPDATLWTERFAGFAKSYVAYR
jgi:hypothetical protein